MNMPAKPHRGERPWGQGVSHFLSHLLRGGRYRTRTCDPLLVRNKRGLEYMGFAAPIPVFMRFWVLVVDGCFVLLRSGWCPRGAPESHFTSVTLRALTRGCADTPHIHLLSIDRGSTLVQ